MHWIFPKVFEEHIIPFSCCAAAYSFLEINHYSFVQNLNRTFVICKMNLIFLLKMRGFKSCDTANKLWLKSFLLLLMYQACTLTKNNVLVTFFNALNQKFKITPFEKTFFQNTLSEMLSNN